MCPARISTSCSLADSEQPNLSPMDDGASPSGVSCGLVAPQHPVDRRLTSPLSLWDEQPSGLLPNALGAARQARNVQSPHPLPLCPARDGGDNGSMSSCWRSACLTTDFVLCFGFGSPSFGGKNCHKRTVTLFRPHRFNLYDTARRVRRTNGMTSAADASETRESRRGPDQQARASKVHSNL